MNSGLKNTFVSARNAVLHFLYKYFLKPILFLFDPEDVHNWFLNIGKLLGRYSVLRWKTRVCFGFSDPILEQTVAGLHFKNPVGLAAGFDKNAEIVPILPAVGFGFAEVGSVTGEPCSGNPRPRLWRLPKSRGLVVHYGLKNHGCEEISARMKKEITAKQMAGEKSEMTDLVRVVSMELNVITKTFYLELQTSLLLTFLQNCLQILEPTKFLTKTNKWGM
jgi:dihydroorotate dehydrogenase